MGIGNVENAKLLLSAGASVEESTKILINFSISVKDERENLMKRIAELEIEQLNKRVLDKKKELHALRTKMEEKKTEINAFIKDVEKEIRKTTIEKQDLSYILQCPVCLDNCKPPLQIWQCREGHILCESCFSRPELKTCPQCRMSLQGNVSRSRVLEELAMKLFPHKVRTPRESCRNHLTIAFPNNG